MAPFNRPPPSIDVYINEIPSGEFRIKVLGTIVSVSSTSIVVNDGTGQLMIQLGVHSTEGLKVGRLGRFVIDVVKKDDDLYSSLIAWHEITAEQLKRYRRLMKIERRLPK